MHLYGTRREAFAEVALSTRANAANRPKAMHPEPLTLEDYFNARMIAEPLCLYDFCQETDGAVAVITTSMERAKDLTTAAGAGGRRRARRCPRMGPGLRVDGHARRILRLLGQCAHRQAALRAGRHQRR